MTKWEYATVPLMVHATKQILDNWGQDGWELVQVLTMPSAGGPSMTGSEMVQAPNVNLVAYLKRPLD
ncbi:MAG: DUF4177 domain-containing protein [Galactobacter sp.]|uniref:DUF4177 domain-containing protein n=1 Tax=Galactobacter sp. TaxID=2676125 RepID=UPI0025B9CAD6|nr:DUF4177 domain-containing protein [Galactobacter sp.]